MLENLRPLAQKLHRQLYLRSLPCSDLWYANTIRIVIRLFN